MNMWQEQAEKNHLIIVQEGSCQLCGSATTKGIAECIDKAAYIPHRLSHDEAVKQMTLFLCVDAFALQHPEIQGPWSLHLHLARLYLILVEKIQWRYRYTPILSSLVDAYKLAAPETIEPPLPMHRGAITITDVEMSDSESQYIDLVGLWALAVFDSFRDGHQVAQSIATDFKSRLI